MASFQIIRFLQILILTASLASLSCAASSLPSISCSSSSDYTQPPSSIEYYVHALDSGAASIVQAVDKNTYGTFGQAAVFAYKIHDGSDLSSTTLGTIRGLEIYDSMDANETTILLLNTVVYDDGVYNGTISMHGQANIKDSDYELTVVGGTGSFRGVAGYAAIHNLRTAGSDHVFEHKLSFFSRQSAFCSSSTI